MRKEETVQKLIESINVEHGGTRNRDEKLPRGCRKLYLTHSSSFPLSLLPAWVFAGSTVFHIDDNVKLGYLDSASTTSGSDI